MAKASELRAGSSVQMTAERYEQFRRDFGPDAPTEAPKGTVRKLEHLYGMDVAEVDWANVPAEALRDMSPRTNVRHLERID